MALWVAILALLQRRALHPAGGPPVPACAASTASVFFSEHVVLPRGRIAPALVHVADDGTIAHVAPGLSASSAQAYASTRGLRFEDLKGQTLSPGLIDAHVHISAVGGRGWEGYATATQAAAAGGITTIIGMPLNSLPPTVNLEALELELEHAATEGVHIDVGLWGGVVPSSLEQGQLERLLADPR
eukprot:3277818-Prymnesium_polylepis.1